MKISIFVIIASCCFSNICLLAKKTVPVSDQITETAMWIYAAQPNKVGASKAYATLYLPKENPEKIAVAVFQNDEKKIKNLHRYLQNLNQNDLVSLSKNLANFATEIDRHTSTFKNKVEIKLGGRKGSPVYETGIEYVISEIGKIAIIGKTLNSKKVTHTLTELSKEIAKIQNEKMQNMKTIPEKKPNAKKVNSSERASQKKR